MWIVVVIMVMEGVRRQTHYVLTGKALFAS